MSTATSPDAPAPDRWWFRPVPLARIAVFRAIAYLFIPVDVFLTTAWVKAHADVPVEWYDPLLVGRLLNLPTPTQTVVVVVQWALVLAALAAATGRAPRLLGTAVFLLYMEWMVIAMSYGKVDHDRIAYLVALAVLPTAQWVMLAVEMAAPLMLLVRSDRARTALVVFLLGFHVMVFAGVTIIFLPHCVAILSILPWERLIAAWGAVSGGGPRQPAPAVGSG